MSSTLLFQRIFEPLQKECVELGQVLSKVIFKKVKEEKSIQEVQDSKKKELCFTEAKSDTDD